MAATATSSAVRTWRTSFLTLRDEALTRSPKSESQSIVELLDSLIFSHSHYLLSAVSQLPSHEVTSDLLFLLELAANSSQRGHDFTSMFSHIAQMMHDIFQRQRIAIRLTPSSWSLVLDSFAKMLQFFLGQADSAFTLHAANIKSAVECIETVRYLVTVYHQKCSQSDEVELVRFLLCIVDCSRAHLVGSSSMTSNDRYAAMTGRRSSKYSSLWEVYTIAFIMLGEAFGRAGASFPAVVWHHTVQVLRKVMEVLPSKSSLVEDAIMSRFYASLLNCLHMVLVDPKDSLLDHVSGFVSTLRVFIIYGLNNRPQSSFPAGSDKGKELNIASLKLTSEESSGGKNQALYRPPHLRKDGLNRMQPKVHDSVHISDQEPLVTDFISSDSDYSDSDSSVKDTDSIQSFKVRIAAIVCIQDLCQADPKSFTTHWTMLLPTNDVLQPRKFEATLMTCLLFDPYFKVRIAAASTLAVMLDGPSSVFLQVAEYKESSKWGSFMALSSLLGRILMQLHTGILHLIQHENHSRLLASLFKILMLLISSTPYSRMPGDLLSTVITSLIKKAESGFRFKSDQTGLLSTTISCLTAALSTSPPSSQVKQMLFQEVSAGAVEAQKRSGVIFMIFQYSEQVTRPTICFEALQALRAVAHNYPSIIMGCWEQVASIVSKILGAAASEVSTRTPKGYVGENIGCIGEKVITASIKVLDECLRAISGFKGTEDAFDEKLLDSPFVSDCTRKKMVSSAPSYEPERIEDINKEQEACLAACKHWSKTIEKHMPPMLSHSSSMVRTASVTCFAGITSAVFSSLTEDKQNFIVSCLVSAAVHDGVPSVRSAACRALGVISCFPQISQSAEILGKFIHAIEVNSHDSLGSVRITASWALANTCDSLRISTDIDSNVNSQLVLLVTECALRLTKDGDKIKSNAVRALGNLSRFVRYTPSLSVAHDKPGESLDLLTSMKLLAASSNSQCGPCSSSVNPAAVDTKVLDRMVQALISCVTTGNVKVQWNVCHAFSNLFLNETLRLHDMDWAASIFSILLLLLRDSSNFKIRIQAAAALSVPVSVLDYGKSFSDIVQGVEHTLENLGSDQISAPSSFKYRIALEKQVTATFLHLLSLASDTDQEPLKDFLVKKSSFLEEWFKSLCASLGDDTTEQPDAGNSVGYQKKQMISKALQSLIKVYESKNQHTVVQRFEKLDNIIIN